MPRSWRAWRRRRPRVRRPRNGETIMVRMASCVLVAGVLLGAPARGDEPTFRDRPLSAWVADLAAKDAGRRKEAAQVLGELGDEAAGAAKALGELLRDEELEVRRAAAQALP